MNWAFFLEIRILWFELGWQCLCFWMRRSRTWLACIAVCLHDLARALFVCFGRQSACACPLMAVLGRPRLFLMWCIRVCVCAYCIFVHGCTSIALVSMSVSACVNDVCTWLGVSQPILAGVDSGAIWTIFFFLFVFIIAAFPKRLTRGGWLLQVVDDVRRSIFYAVEGH